MAGLDQRGEHGAQPVGDEELTALGGEPPAGSRQSSGSTLGCSRSSTFSRSWSSAWARPVVRDPEAAGGGVAVGADEYDAVAGLDERLRHRLGHVGVGPPDPAGATVMTFGLGSRSRIVARRRRMVVSTASASPRRSSRVRRLRRRDGGDHRQPGRLRPRSRPDLSTERCSRTASRQPRPGRPAHPRRASAAR